MQVYILEEATGQIVFYNSLNEFKRQRFQHEKSSSRLRGCFNQNGQFGTIEVKPFAVSVKGLDSDYDYRHEYKIQQWRALVGFMQYKCMKQPDNAKQFVDKLCKGFLKSLKRAEQKGTSVIGFKATTVLISSKALRQGSLEPSNLCESPSKRSTQPAPAYPLMNHEDIINRRVSELAQTCIKEPSKTTQKLNDLRNNGIISNQSGTSDQILTEK